jgi:hypothetical protein
MRKIFFFIIYACSDKEKYDFMNRKNFSLNDSSYNKDNNNNTEKVSTMKFPSSNSRRSSETSEFPDKYYPKDKKSFHHDSELRFSLISNPEHNGDYSFYKRLLDNAKTNEKIIKNSECLIKFFNEKILYENYPEENFICFILNKLKALILFLETIIESRNLSEEVKRNIEFHFFIENFFEYIENFIEQKLDEFEKNEKKTKTELEIIEYFNKFFYEIKNELYVYEKNNEEIILILKNYLEELKNDIEKFYKNDDEKNNKNKYVDFNIEEIKNENENDKIKKEIETQTTYRIKYISPEDSHSQKSNIYSKNKNESDLKSQTETLLLTNTSKSFSVSDCKVRKRTKYNLNNNNLPLAKKGSISFFTVYEKTKKNRDNRDNRKNVKSKNTKDKFKKSLNSNSNSKKSLKKNSSNNPNNCSKSFLYKCGSNNNSRDTYDYYTLLKKKL